MNQIRVLVLDDSSICRSQLRTFLEAEGDIVVVGEAPDGREALRLIGETQPDLLVVDLQMPGTDGHHTISEVMANSPRPIFVVTGQPLGPGREAVFESVRRGALDLAEKPASGDEEAQARLRQTVRRLASLPVVRHVEGKLKKPSDLPRTPTPHFDVELRGIEPSVIPPALTSGTAPLLVGIGSSAGGPMALAQVLSALPATLGAAVLVVQHLPASFTGAFVEFLESKTALKVRAVDKAVKLEVGVVYVAPGDRHLGLTSSSVVAALRGPPVGGHCPAVDVLFQSMAKYAGSRATGIILSGIGHDGTEGLHALRRAGALCLGQSKESAAVWGMPKSASESGATEQSLAPPELAQVCLRWVKSEGRR